MSRKKKKNISYYYHKHISAKNLVLIPLCWRAQSKHIILLIINIKNSERQCIEEEIKKKGGGGGLNCLLLPKMEVQCKFATGKIRIKMIPIKNRLSLLLMELKIIF